MERVAIPVFRSRIAPVFDSCLRVLIVDIEHDRQTQIAELHMGGLGLSERVLALTSAGVTSLICGAISDVLCIMLESSGISVIAGIMGQADEVLAAFLSNQLNKPEFCMPGFGASTPYSPKDLKDFSGQA